MKKKTKSKKPALWWTHDPSRIKFCYVCGGLLVLRLVPQDKQRRRVCIQCSAINYVNPTTVASLIPVAPDGRIVLLKRSIDPQAGKWTFPGGHQEIGETVKKAALRETWEEIRVRPTLDRLLGVYSYPFSRIVTVVFVGRLKRGEKPSTTPEATEVRFFRPKEIPWSDLAFPSNVDALKDWQKLV